MRLHCLGTAGYHPSETRQTSCYFFPEAGIVLDAGSGIFRLPSLIQTDHLDILLSHAHLDHIAGLTYLLDVLHERPVPEVRIWGEAEKLNAVREHLFHQLVFPVELPVTWHAIDDRPTITLPSADVQWHPQEHPGGSVAYRLDLRPEETQRAEESSDNPLRIVYATDTVGSLDGRFLHWMGRPAWLMHECNFANSEAEWAEKTGHCYVDRVSEIAKASDSHNVLLTHINPLRELDPSEVEPAFDRPVSIASDHMEICLKSAAPTVAGG